ncbi:hypothetical protein RUM43_003316 [Polyplax serrata]|uniref:Uncharacterized protein n=1 Tax=Polyplax serrata TaxID=468196 RepID=A0AAN8S6G1_POLSC
MAKEATNNKNNMGNADDIEKILSVVVKRRKTLPSKCMELHKKMSTTELQRLVNSTVVLERNIVQENIRRVKKNIKGLKNLRYSPDDINQAENKLMQHYAKVKEINLYLKKTRKIQNAQQGDK